MSIPGAILARQSRARALLASTAVVGLGALLLVLGFAVFTASDTGTGTVTAADTFDLNGPYAIFGMMEECPSDEGVTWTGTDGSVTGRTHTNADLRVDGSGSNFDGEVTYVCDVTIGGSGHTFSDGPNQVSSRAIVLPLRFEDVFPDDCDFMVSGTLTSIPAAGVYCADGDIQLSVSNITATATFVARGRIHVSGTNINLTSYHPSGVLFLSDDDGSDAIYLDIEISGSRSIFGGVQAAPKGRMDSSSHDVTFNGCLIAQIVRIAGNRTIVDAMHPDAFGCAGVVEGTVSVEVDDLDFFQVDPGTGDITANPCGPMAPGDICRAEGNVTYTGTLAAMLEVDGAFDETMAGCFVVTGEIDSTPLFQAADPDFGPVNVSPGDSFTYVVDVELPSDADNACQSQTVDFTISATATAS